MPYLERLSEANGSKDPVRTISEVKYKDRKEAKPGNEKAQDMTRNFQPLSRGFN